MKKLEKSEIVPGLKLYNPFQNWCLVKEIKSENEREVEVYCPHQPSYCNDRISYYSIDKVYDNSDDEIGDINLWDFHDYLFTKEFDLQIISKENKTIGKLKPLFKELRKDWFNTINCFEYKNKE